MRDRTPGTVGPEGESAPAERSEPRPPVRRLAPPPRDEPSTVAEEPTTPVDGSPDHSAAAADRVEEEPAGTFLELYVNVGRKEGVRTRDLRELLHDDGGLPHEEVGRVRIRDRCSFVEVARDRVDAAIALLERGSFEGRDVRANVSERAQRG